MSKKEEKASKISNKELEHRFFELLDNEDFDDIDELKRIIAMHPAVLLSSKEGHPGCTPLHFACSFLYRYGSHDLLYFLMQQNPDALKIVDGDGYYPLHRLCQLQPWHDHRYQCDYESLRNYCNYETPYEVYEQMVKEFPLALRTQNRHGSTPLHITCSIDYEKWPHTIDENLLLQKVELFVNTCPQALQLRDVGGYTPFQVACESCKSLSAIKLLYSTFSLAAQWRNNAGDTPFYSACNMGQLEIIEFVAECWPVTCLFPKMRTSFIFQLYFEVNERLTVMTKEVVYALSDVAFHVKYVLPDTVMKQVAQRVVHYRNTSTLFDVILVSNKSFELDPEPFAVPTIIVSEEMQDLLKNDDDLQEVLDGVIRMNRAGRHYFQEQPENKRQGVKVLQAVANSVNGLFLHIRENPILSKRW